MSIGYSKDQQLAHHEKRKKDKLSNKAQGTAFETEVAAAFNGKRNHQGRRGGGISNPDVSALFDWNFEAKDEKDLNVHKTLKEHCDSTPQGKKPGLVFTSNGIAWMCIPLAFKNNFAADLAEAAGAEVYWP